MKHLELISETEKMLTYRDEEIKTTWKISLTSNRFYRKSDLLYATQDIKFPDDYTKEQAIQLLTEKSTKHRKRILKAGGHAIRGCLYGNRFKSL